MRIICRALIFFISLNTYAQAIDNPIELNFVEYLGYVKKYHPIAKQANLVVDEGQAKLMKARGAFDPKIDVDYATKSFKGSEYYDVLNATFKVPTWFGVEFKGGFEQNDGVYLNPERTVPVDGLYSAGVTVPLAQGLLTNDRMATLRQAKFYREQAKADSDALVNEILFEASIAYFDWLANYNELQVYANFLSNAEIRFQGVKQSALLGEKAAIDTVEAKITVQNRQLSFEQARLKFIKSKLQLSTFLWLENSVPVELQPNVVPSTLNTEVIALTLGIEADNFTEEMVTDNAKIRSLGYKIDGLKVEKRLRLNNLLPVIDVNYNFLTETPDYLNSLNTSAYKGGVTIKLPLFLRKERGDLKLAKIKLQDTSFEFDSAQLTVRNKLIASYQEIDSYTTQTEMIEDLVVNYQAMLSAEERKFNYGESSLFLVNSREKSLIDVKLKENQLQFKTFSATASLFKNLGINPGNL